MDHYNGLFIDHGLHIIDINEPERMMMHDIYIYIYIYVMDVLFVCL